MKNKILITSFLIWGVNNMKAQETANAAGGDANGLGGTAAYSVGQVVYTDVKSASGAMAQGVQQLYDVVITGGNTNTDINLLVSVYPNPSTAFINLNVGKQDLQNLSFQLFDVQGKLLINQKIYAVETSIMMEAFATGSYFLKVIDKNSEVKNFKINKN